jgi:YVTN family beta-propeller protein
VGRPSVRSGRGFRRSGTILLVVFGLALVLPLASATSVPGSLQTSPPLALIHSVTSGKSCVVGHQGFFDVYDPYNRYVYDPNGAAGTVSVLLGCKLVATVSLPSGAYPSVAGYDPANHWVYVTVYGNLVYVLSGTKVIHTIKSSHFDVPDGVSYDPAAKLMAVANGFSNYVTFVSGTTVVGTTTVGTSPAFFAYDSASNRLLVTNTGSSNVTSMNATYPMVESDNLNIAVGSNPYGIAFDPIDSRDYVANQVSDNVSVISGNGGEFGSVPVGSEPAGVVWDHAQLRIFVTNYYSSNVSVIEGLSVVNTFYGPSGVQFIGIAYDVMSDRVFVTAANNYSVYTYV